MTTIQEILDLPRFSDLTLVNKKADTSRKVDTIEISETPDVSGYLPKNALLLTTGMVFQDNPLGLRDLISSLNSLPTAGLAIKLGRYISEIDPEVIEHADKLQFPLIQIPVARTLGDISHQLLSFVWDNHTELMYFALDIQRKFSNLMMKGATVNALVNHLSSLIKRPILLFNPFGEIEAKSRDIKNSHLIHDSLLKELTADVREIQKDPKSTSLLKDINEDEKLLLTIYPIGTNHYFPHVLVILKSDQLPYPFSQLAIEQAISVLSYTIYKDRILLVNKKSTQKEFLQKVLAINSENASEINNWVDYGKPFGIIESIYYRIIISEFSIPQNMDYHSEEIESLVYEWFTNFIPSYLSHTLVVMLNNQQQIVLLIQQNEHDLREILAKIKQDMYDTLHVSLTFGVGNPINDIKLIKFSYGEAQEIMETPPLNNETGIYFYENEGIRSLIQTVPADDISYFCVNTLGRLAYPESENDIELRKTLHMYLNKQCRITETAEELFIHRNTVKYRIAKCEQLFGKPIDDPELSIQLRVALLLSSTKKNAL